MPGPPGGRSGADLWRHEPSGGTSGLPGRAADPEGSYAPSPAVRAASTDWLASAPSAHAPDLAFVAHGAVAALLLAHLSGAAISHDFVQPLPAPGGPPGSGGGNYFRFSLHSLELEHGWRAIDPG